MTTHDNNSLIGWIKAFLIAAVIAVLLNTFIFSSSIVEGISMEPTLQDEDRIIFNKLIYLVSEPGRGDIVMIKKDNKNYVKRIIGMPGESIKMSNHNLYINNEEQHQTYVDRHGDILTGSFGPTEIPHDYYYVIGDNRAVSKDSRNGLGLIKRDEIAGRSEFILYPFSHVSKTK